MPGLPRRTLVSALALLALTACGGSAKVRLELANQTPSAGPAKLDAAAVAGFDRTFRMKLVAVYLAEDVDPVTQDNRGGTSMIWLNPECGGDIDHCTPTGIPGGGPRIQEFFDFSQPTEVVNAVLNGQGNKVDVGTFRYARIEFCKYGTPADPNLRWSGPGMAGERALSVGDCGRTSRAFDPPLELKDGDQVTVTLAYDLATSIVAGAPAASGGGFSIDGVDHWFRDCADVDATHRVCMDFPEFVATASK